ncbi:MAG: DUF4013 domain-containing protein [Methanoregula sp.]|jgi:hypothetical protein
MQFENVLSDSLSYTKEGILGNVKRWLLLIPCLIIFPLILGYLVRIYRGEKPAPELENWWLMFVDGLKLFVVEFIYAIPIILLAIIAFLPLISAFIASGGLTLDFASMTNTQTEQWFTSHPEIISAFMTMMILLLVTFIIAIIISIFSFIGTVRFARTGRIGEAFNFSAIVGQIGRIGWLTYILALIVIGVIGVIVWIILRLFLLVPVAGGILYLIVALIVYPPFVVFTSRYAAQVYEAGEPTATPENP